MKSLIFISLLSALPFAHTVDFVPFIYAPQEVTADTPFEARIHVEQHNLETTYCHAFRVYLATRPGEETRPTFYRSDCYLLYSQTLCDPSIEIASDYILYENTTFTVSIPSSIGPSGRHYVLKAQTLKTDGSHYGGSLESNVFELKGGKAEWGTYQLEGYTLWGSDGIPCENYDCVRECGNAALAARKRGLDGDESESQNSMYDECVNACPDVFVDPTSTRGGQPTASLTKPTTCALSDGPTATATATTTTTTQGSDGDGDFLEPTGSRSAAAAAGTGAASPVLRVGVAGVCVAFAAFIFTF